MIFILNMSLDKPEGEGSESVLTFFFFFALLTGVVLTNTRYEGLAYKTEVFEVLGDDGKIHMVIGLNDDKVEKRGVIIEYVILPHDIDLPGGIGYTNYQQLKDGEVAPTVNQGRVTKRILYSPDRVIIEQ